MKLVIQNMSRVWGGNEKWLSILGTGLSARGHDVIVSVPKGDVRDRLAQLGLRTTSARPRGVVDFVSGFWFAAWLRAQRPDAILLTSWHSIAWSALAARLAGRPRLIVRQGIVRKAPSRGARALALRNEIDAMIVNSPEIKREWLASAPSFDPDKVKVVLNAIESRVPAREYLRRKLRQELGVADDQMLIGSAGNLFKRKGFDILLHAFAHSKIEGAHLVIVGAGAERQELESIARSLEVETKVHWLGHREDAPQLIAGLDMFVLSSSNEGMANVMLEAMAGGTPVVAFDISGVRTAIGPTDGRPVAGWIVPSNNPTALTQTMTELSKLIRSGDDEVNARVHEAAWRIENWFGTDRMIDECERILFG
jgi:glycosyltransferase involved in cell wall biosynthesis